MCIYPLTQENLENLKNFKYKSTNESILYNKFMSPCLNKLINYIPKNIAPNLITIISLCKESGKLFAFTLFQNVATVKSSSSSVLTTI